MGEFWWLLPTCLVSGLAGGVLGAWLLSRRTGPGVAAPAVDSSGREVAALRVEVGRLARRLDAWSGPAQCVPALVPAPCAEPPATLQRAAPVASAPPPVAVAPAPREFAAVPVVVRAPAPALPAELAAQALLKLTDDEIDALPAELPAAVKPRKRMQSPPRKPPFSRL